jgi:hypothetical protein
LDDYEEGTWTPELEGTTGNPSSVTYGNLNKGSYQKIGDRVTVQGILHITAYTGGTGDIVIAGLPFASTAIASNGNGGSYPIGTVRLDFLNTPDDVIGSHCLIPSDTSTDKMYMVDGFGFSEVAA